MKAENRQPYVVMKSPGLMYYRGVERDEEFSTVMDVDLSVMC